MSQAATVERGLVFGSDMDVVYVRVMWEGRERGWRKAGKRQALTFRRPAPFLAAPAPCWPPR